MVRETRPEWAWRVYNNWRKRSPVGCNDFEGAGWFKEGKAWCRQSAHGKRISVFEDGRVHVSSDTYNWG